MHKHKEEGREVNTKQAAYKIQLDFYFPSLSFTHSLVVSLFAFRFCALILIACSFSNQADKRGAFPNAASRLVAGKWSQEATSISPAPFLCWRANCARGREIKWKGRRCWR